MLATTLDEFPCLFILYLAGKISLIETLAPEGERISSCKLSSNLHSCTVTHTYTFMNTRAGTHVRTHTQAERRMYEEVFNEKLHTCLVGEQKLCSD